MKKICLIICILLGMTAQAQEKETMVLIKTTKGDITVKLYNDTPLHRDNFIKLINEGWFNNSPFHRVINNFMIQGGHNQDGRIDPGYTIPAEFRANHFHKKGALAAARQGDQVNPKKASSGCQFYIVQGNVLTDAQIQMFQQRYGLSFTEEQIETYKTIGGTPHLDGEYTVFGEVVEGLDVIDKIASVKTDYMDVPVEPVTMTIEIINN